MLKRQVLYLVEINDVQRAGGARAVEVFEEDDAHATQVAMGEALERYLAGIKPAVEYSTFHDYESAVRHHLQPAFGVIPLRELTTRAIRAWTGGLPISAKRINNVLVPLRGMLADAFADGLIALEWQDVDWRRQRVRVRRAGARYRSPYQTRHTYASTLLSAGENPMWVAQQMGHADWAMIRKVYGRWVSEVDPTAGERIGALLAGQTCDQTGTKASPNQTSRDLRPVPEEGPRVADSNGPWVVWAGPDGTGGKDGDGGGGGNQSAR